LKIESGIHAGLSPRLLRLDAGFARQPNPFFDIGVHQPRKLLAWRIRANIRRPLVSFFVFVDRISGLSWQC
jgi:hypothetical protein